MREERIHQRILAVERFRNGESPESICASFHKSRSWLYKWVSRYDDHDASWSANQSCRPKKAANFTPDETVEIVKLIHLDLYSHDLFFGAQAIQWEMEDQGLKPLPSVRTINRILSPARSHLQANRQIRSKRNSLSSFIVCESQPDAPSRSGRAMLPERPCALLQP